jgi:hypothetical protein
MKFEATIDKDFGGDVVDGWPLPKFPMPLKWNFTDKVIGTVTAAWVEDDCLKIRGEFKVDKLIDLLDLCNRLKMLKNGFTVFYDEDGVVDRVVVRDEE